MILIKLLIILAILLAAVGFGLLWTGWRGRKVDRHPRCNKCGYDLTNRPEDQQRCPECGSWIMARGAIRYGTFEKRPRLAMLGVLLMLAGGFGSVVSVLSAMGRLDVIDYLPTVWVARYRWDDDRVAWKVYELLSSGKLSARQIGTIVDDILQRQADPKVRWRPSWGNVVAVAQRNGLLDKPRWETYLRQGVSVDIRVRERVRKGDPIPLEAWFTKGRLGDATFLRAGWSGTVEHRAIPAGSADAKFMEPYEWRSQPKYNGQPHEVAWVPTNTESWASIAPGRETITIKGTISIVGSPLTLSYDKVVELLPADQPSAKAVSWPDLHERISKGIMAILYNSYDGIVFDVRRAPVDLAFEAILRSGQREWPIGKFAVPSHGQPEKVERRIGMKWPSLDAKRVEIVLRPSAAAAARTVDITEYWNGEIVLEVEWPEQ